MSARGTGVHATVAEVAEFWDLTPRQVMRLCERYDRGEPNGLPYVRFGGRRGPVRICWADVDNYGRATIERPQLAPIRALR
jgi:hypothetical protein